MFAIKECPECGLYNDIPTQTCSCGEDVTAVTPRLVEDIPIELYGNIDESLPIYVQKCPFCQTQNYTYSPDHPVKKCSYCQRMRVGQVDATLMQGTAPEAEPQPENTPAPDSHREPAQTPSKEPVSSKEEKTPHSGKSPVTEEVMQLRSEWADVVSKIFGTQINPEASDATPRQSPQTTQSAPTVPQALRITACGALVGLAETFEPTQAPVLLGRYASDLLDRSDRRMAQYIRCEDFLQQDKRVSGYHCHLLVRDNVWYVRDGSWSVPAKQIPQQPSKASTQVNSRVVSGEQMLRQGDILKLGNQPDSVQFRVEMVPCK